jgi:hypothetical protein
MTHPSDAPSDASYEKGAAGYLVLDEGERLDVRIGGDEVILRLPASRAHDLSFVLETYSRFGDLASVTSTVSATEQSLARALRDAAAAAGHVASASSPVPSISSGARLKAMAKLQSACPDLSHSTLVAIVDAVLWLIDQDEDYDVAGVLDAITLDSTGADAYLTLVGHNEPSIDPEEGTR